LTDVDIWLYERPTGSFRRRQIVDAKFKAKPKAVERLLWTKGLLELLQVDGAYVATTDNRPMLKDISSRLGILVLDGADLKRMGDSEKVFFADRMSEDDLDKSIKAVDKGRRNKILQLAYQDLKAGLIDNFGSGTVNRTLEHFISFVQSLGSSHPNSAAAGVLLRLTYISASIISVALDYSLAQVAFKSPDERRKTILNVIRYGDEDAVSGMEKVRVAAALVERYAQNGRSISQSMLNSVQADFQSIPAEIIADHVLIQLKGDALFRIARSLEYEGFKIELKGYDQLSIEEKSFLGVLMDFAGLDRSKFAEAWSGSEAAQTTTIQSKTNSNGESDSLGSLFDT
jgi:hypothetical protein